MRISNKKAYFDYDVLEAFEAGIVLSGPEVKSIKEGAMSMMGARVVIGAAEDGEREGAWLVGATVTPYKNATDPSYDQLRSRKLLLKSDQLEYLRSKMKTKGLTVVPLSCYTKGDLIKVEIALVRGKKQFEKREEERKREIDKKLKVLVKSQNQRS
jgi:SsrA-binding protein